MTLAIDARVVLGSLDLRVAMSVHPGEVVGLVGPNGAGKSTLLRAIAGLTPLTSGRIALEDRVLEDTASGQSLPAEQRAVGMVFQHYLLFPHLSALENVAFGPRARGVPKGRARDAAADWLRRVGLGSHATSRPATLSGGQQQRVALARALAADPACLLLDEPLAALDVEARRDIRQELRRHLEAFPGPTVIVTHEPLEALALADRLVVLEAGRVVQEGGVRDVARQPRSPWIARLVGLNLYRGTAHGGAVEVAGGGTLVAADGPPTGEVFATVHPAAVTLHRERPSGSARNVWPGTVAGLEILGDHVRVQVDGAPPIVAEVTPAAVADLGLAAGGPVWVAAKASEVTVYRR